MKKIFALFIMGGIFSIITLNSVLAHCPLCTTGAAVGIGFTRTYGVDDSIVGLFIGALIASSALWFNKWFKKKIDFPLQTLLLMIISFLLITVPFYYKGIIIDFAMVKSIPEVHGMTGFGVLGLANLGVDKLLFGMILGTLAIWSVFALSDRIKKINGKVLFPYQGMVFMIIALAVLSWALWMAIK